MSQDGEEVVRKVPKSVIYHLKGLFLIGYVTTSVFESNKASLEKHLEGFFPSFLYDEYKRVRPLMSSHKSGWSSS